MPTISKFRSLDSSKTEKQNLDYTTIIDPSGTYSIVNIGGLKKIKGIWKTDKCPDINIPGDASHNSTTPMKHSTTSTSMKPSTTSAPTSTVKPSTTSTSMKPSTTSTSMKPSTTPGDKEDYLGKYWWIIVVIVILITSSLIGIIFVV